MATPIPASSTIAPRSSQSMWKYSRRSNMGSVLAGGAASEPIAQIEAHLLTGRRRRQRPPFLLGEVGFENVLRHRGGVGAVDAVLEEHDAGDLRIVARREEREPAVI